jgi:hypothetical protein
MQQVRKRSVHTAGHFTNGELGLNENERLVALKREIKKKTYPKSV